MLGVGAGVWYINSGQFTRVPSLLGQPEKTATSRLSAAGLDVKRTERKFSDTYDRGQVMSSSPASGARIRDNDAVSLVISRGPRVVRVPRVEGRPLAQAKQDLTKAGLASGMVTKEFSEDVGRGKVIRTDPGSGTERHADSAIALVVSKGAPVDVPDVTGESLDDARADLKDENLKVVVAPERINSTEDAGQVAKQSPAEGARAEEGDTITLTVSKGPRMISVPDVTGDNVDDAKSALTDKGFKVHVDRPFLSFSDTVDSQSVDGGGRAPEGSTITIKTKGL